MIAPTATEIKAAREQGAREMRESVKRLLAQAGIEFTLPKTQGERMAFERAFDAQVKAGKA